MIDAFDVTESVEDDFRPSWNVSPMQGIPFISERLHGEDEEELLCFAGLYEYWPDPTKDEDAEDKWLVTATILTT